MPLGSLIMIANCLAALQVVSAARSRVRVVLTKTRHGYLVQSLKRTIENHDIEAADLWDCRSGLNKAYQLGFLHASFHDSQSLPLGLPLRCRDPQWCASMIEPNLHF